MHRSRHSGITCFSSVFHCGKTRGALRRMSDQDRSQLSEIEIEIVSLYSQAEPKLKSQPKQSPTGRGRAGQGVHAFDSRFVWPKQPLLPALTASLPRLLLLFVAAAAAAGAAAAAAVGALSVRGFRIFLVLWLWYKYAMRCASYSITHSTLQPRSSQVKQPNPPKCSSW